MRGADGRGRNWAGASLLVLTGALLGALTTHRLVRSPSRFPDVAARLSRSVVLVWYQDASGWDSYGTAFAVDDSGHFLTCAHVVHGMKEVTIAVPSPDGEKNHRARVVAEDPMVDAALLLAEGMGVPPVRLGASGAVGLGEEVAFIGFPLGYTVSAELTPSLSVGHIGAVPWWRVEPRGPRLPLLQVDASVAIGHSGSPLFLRATGEVVGMMKSQIRVPGVAVTRDGVRAEIEAIPDEVALQTGIGLALPMDELRLFLAQHGVAP